MIGSLLLCLVLVASPAWAVESNGDRSVKTISFPKGKTETVIAGRIQGRADRGVIGRGLQEGIRYTS